MKRLWVPNRRLLKNIVQLPKQFMAWVLRLAFKSARFSRTREAGFVLPTTVMLLVVLTLTVGGLSVRSFSRVKQTIAYREQQIVDNFSAPAIDRAKAKIEYLFTQDRDIIDKRPPSSSDLIDALLRYSRPVDQGGDGKTWGAATQTADDPYTLPDETQLDINGDGNPDPAWSFVSDGNTVVYSLLTSHEARDGSGNLLQDSAGQDLTLSSDKTAEKADNLITRNGPINTAKTNASCPIDVIAGDGWQDAGGNLQKNLQVDILSIANAGDFNRTVSAAEYQQVRAVPKGSKYGAWFRYDLELHPGPLFRWNGAMHSESNFSAYRSLRAYLISSPDSCVFSADDSEVSVSESSYDTDGDGTDDTTFFGNLVAGMSSNNSFGASNVSFHKYDGYNPDADPDVSQNELNTTTDSITPKSGTKFADIAVDPVLIFTEDRTQNLTPEGPATWEMNSTDRDDQNISDNLLSGSTRVKDFPDAARPFVDDGFRADNRYGPKPVYDNENSFLMKDGELFSDLGEANKLLGQPIVNHDALASDNPDEQEYGLDGYWERRAISQGLRVVVGQRLELGNQFGWKGQESSADDNDPLYPPTKVAELKGSSSTGKKGPARAKQQRSLRDNLSAVQGMVAYHYSVDAGQVPYFCAASTVHPGTAQTLIKSRTFEKYPETNSWKIDFLTGQGTNGWEFDFSSFDSNSDGDITDEFVATRPMGKALRNLAHFAGDPRGGAPSFSPKQGVKDNTVGSALADDDEFVHPYPYLSMWGDFSVLRRIFDEYMDASTPVAYASLSPADKSTLHSAACTLGMLAYNLEAEQGVFDAVLSDTGINWTNMGVKLTQLFDMNNINNGSPIIGRPLSTDPNYKAPGLCKGTQASAPDYTDPNWTGCPSQNPNDVTSTSDPEHPENYFSQFSTEEWIDALVSTGSLSTDQANALTALVSSSSLQILRDRRLGFNAASSFTGDISPIGNYVNDTSIWTNPTGSDAVNAGEIDPGDTLQIGCDPDYFQSGELASSGSGRARLGLAVVLCANDLSPKYPSLYYLFPDFDHGHLGADGSATAGVGIDHTQPATEEYINEGGGDIYIADADTTTTKANDGYTYLTVDPATVALTPRSTVSDFKQPTATVSGGSLSSRDDLQESLIDANGTISELAFLDKAMMDGRQLLSVRVLDLDIDKLTEIDTTDATTYFTVDTDRIAWIPEVDGIFYAAREDAVREDSIVRPRKAQWSVCKVFANLVDNSKNCPMDVVPNTDAANQKGTYDPPLADNLISPKPVDMYADPDRRPHGFRLINGATLNRSADDRASGLTFVSDNPAYIYGDFNLHQDSSGTIIEEFVDGGGYTKQTLGTDFATEGATDAFNRFYGRKNLDTRFARGGQDLWRPSEVFADAVTILSRDFRDGFIEDAYRYKTDGSKTAVESDVVASSYLNSDRPKITVTKPESNWQREDLQEQASMDINLPIRFDRNGKPAQISSGTFKLFPDNFTGEHIEINDFDQRQKNQIPAASPTRVNALLIAGIVPLRAGQGYGGLHNFPRLTEYWYGKSLIISGAFYQLNFSASSTAPWDQDAWEPGATPTTSGQHIAFYGAATRVWGYDVGFQYTSISPIARRFVSVGRPRSEFYRELALEDAYVSNLCEAKDSTGNLVLGSNADCQ